MWLYMYVQIYILFNIVQNAKTKNMKCLMTKIYQCQIERPSSSAKQSVNEINITDFVQINKNYERDISRILLQIHVQ